MLCAAPLYAAPAAAPTSPAKTIADYKKELGITDKQLQDIVAVLNGFKSTVDTEQKQLLADEQDFQKLIASHADLATIKAKLQQIADLRVKVRLVDVETSRKIEGVLTPEQLNKWRAIQAKARAASANKK
jgi:Spy/CpxP family protein refolding chaperone